MSLFDASEDANRQSPALGGADAAQNARRVRRPAALLGRRKALAAAAGGRPPGVGHLLWPARHRQDDARPAAGRRHAEPLPPDQRGGQRREGTPRDSHRGLRPALRLRPADALVCGRNPPFQQGPAGRAPARRRGGGGDPGGRDHRKPLLHDQQRPGQPQPRLPVRAALERRHQDARPPRGGRQGPRPGPIQNPPPRRRPGLPGGNERRRRPPGDLRPGGRRALQPRVAGRVHPPVGRRVGAAEGGAIRPAGGRPLRLDSARSSRASAAATPTPRSTGSPGCSKGARTSASWPGGW